MTRVLALDISTRTGWALFVDGKLKESGQVELGFTVRGYGGHSYPWDYLQAIATMTTKLFSLIYFLYPDVIVIEETNGGGRSSRYSQKVLEWLHHALLSQIQDRKVVYVNTGDWRRATGVQMTRADRNQNARLARAKRRARGGKIDRKALGIRGRLTVKHLSVRRANEKFGLALKQQENDRADALNLGDAYLMGVKTCDGT